MEILSVLKLISLSTVLSAFERICTFFMPGELSAMLVIDGSGMGTLTMAYEAMSAHAQFSFLSVSSTLIRL